MVVLPTSINYSIASNLKLLVTIKDVSESSPSRQKCAATLAVLEKLTLTPASLASSDNRERVLYITIDY